MDVPSTLDNPLLTRDEWLRLATEAAGLGLWHWDEVNQRLFWDRKSREIFAVTLTGDVTLDTFYTALHPADRDRVRKVWRGDLENGRSCEVEYRVLRPDGSIRWISARGSCYCDPSGVPLYMVGVHLDITDRKAMEQDRLDLSGRLLNAQEQERKRLAQEIHDDFCQRFAGLRGRLRTVATNVGDRECSLLLQQLSTDFGRLASDLQSLSHRLHSSVLDLLGLVPSVDVLCVVLSKEHGIDVKFAHSNVPDALSGDAALSLFRINQEAMHNVVKHSRASKIDISLNGASDAVSLAGKVRVAFSASVFDVRWCSAACVGSNMPST